MPKTFGEASLTVMFELIEEKVNLLKAENSALEKRVKALETALNGFSFGDDLSAPETANAKHITFVDLS